jgi:signal transduction histidine kinase
LNILKNAVQAVGAGGTIRVVTSRDESSCVFQIQDTGPGITEADIPYIFDPFFTTKKTGTGLGLAITHRIIEEHKGRIEVESKPGEGTTFSVFLPLT